MNEKPTLKDIIIGIAMLALTIFIAYKVAYPVGIETGEAVVKSGEAVAKEYSAFELLKMIAMVFGTLGVAAIMGTMMNEAKKNARNEIDGESSDQDHN